MSESPYINWYTSDFLNGVADLTPEQGWVYVIVLNLIADKAAPIEDDPQGIAHRCRMSTRKCNAILAELAAMPNKIVRKNGIIGNTKMLKEVRARSKKSKQATEAANARWEAWRSENKPQLFADNGTINSKKRRKSKENNYADAFLGENTPKTEFISDLSPKKTRDKREINDTIIPENPQNSANVAMRTHSDSRAGVIPEPESRQTNDQNLLNGSARENLDRSIDSDAGKPEQGAPESPPTLRDKDLAQLVDLCTSAAGFYPRTPGAIAREFDLVKEWRNLGMDFEGVVVPTIKLGIEGSVDPTSSLLRFDRKVRFAHAQSAAQSAKGPVPPPPVPKFDFDAESAAMRKFRADLAEAIGHRSYATIMNRAQLELARTGNGSKPLRIKRSPSDPFRLLDGDRTAKAQAIALKHGFTAIWE